MTGEERTELADRIAAAESRLEALRAVEPTPPDIVVERVVELADAAPLVRVTPMGAAHTAGDVTVSVPAVRLFAIGDLIEDGFPWFGDGYPVEWARVLDRIAAREPEIILPAHGPVLRDREMLETQRAFMHELVRAARAGRDAGMSESEALGSADFTAFRPHFTRRPAELSEAERQARFEDFVAAAFSRAWAEAGGELP